MLKVKLSYEALDHIRNLLERVGEKEDLYTKFAAAWNRDYVFGSPTVSLEETEVEYVRRMLKGHIDNPTTTNTERALSRRILAEFDSRASR